MLSGDDMSPNRNPWIRGKGRRSYARPRLFTPYVEEAKVITRLNFLSYFPIIRVTKHLINTLANWSCIVDLAGHVWLSFGNLRSSYMTLATPKCFS